MTDQDADLNVSEILSEPEIATTETTTTEPTTAGSEQQRDEHGRFAPKATETTTVAAGTEQQPPVKQQEEQAGAMVPQQALHAARQENADLKRQLAELSGRVDQLTRQPAPQQPAPKPVEQQKPKEIWDDPDQFIGERMKSALTPVEQMVKGMIFNTSHQNAMRDPEVGAERIRAAETWAEEAVRTGRIDGRALAAKLSQSFDPVGDLVREHRKASALERVGTDPDKWLESELEKRLSDPAQQAAILQRIQQSASARPATGQAPVTALPPSISRIPTGGNAVAEPDMSDAGLFAHAMSG